MPSPHHGRFGSSLISARLTGTDSEQSQRKTSPRPLYTKLHHSCSTGNFFAGKKSSCVTEAAYSQLRWKTPHNIPRGNVRDYCGSLESLPDVMRVKIQPLIAEEEQHLPPQTILLMLPSSCWTCGPGHPAAHLPANESLPGSAKTLNDPSGFL